jgi:hypothetical protein
MNAPALIPTDSLPTLIDKASAALANARTSAEVLEARDLASIAYDAAKKAARMARAKQAHDSIIAEVHRAQGHSLAIRARAEIRLAEEYDAAQERGEVARGSVRTDIVAGPNDVRPATAADLGLRRDEIHEARKLRDAELASPGIVETTINELVGRGEEPTKAKLRESVLAAVAEARKPVDRRNPDYRPNPMNDAVLTFTDACLEISQAKITALAAWNGRDLTRARMIEAARAAMPALQQFISMIGDTDA